MPLCNQICPLYTTGSLNNIPGSIDSHLHSPIYNNTVFTSRCADFYSLFYHENKYLFAFIQCFSCFDQVTQRSLRQHIGVVPQDTVLFNDTVRYAMRSCIEFDVLRTQEAAVYSLSVCMEYTKISRLCGLQAILRKPIPFVHALLGRRL